MTIVGNATGAVLAALGLDLAWGLPTVITLALSGTGTWMMVRYHRKHTGKWLRELYDVIGKADPGPLKGPREVEALWTEFVQYVEEIRQSQVEASSRQVRSNLIQNENERLRAIFHALPVGIMVLRSSNRILYANEVAEDLLKIAGQEEPVLEASEGDPRVLAAVRSVLVGDLAGGVRAERVELVLPDKTTQVYLIKLLTGSSSRRMQQDENIQIVTFEDATSEESTQRMKSEFVYGVSHELKTPLTSIQASLEMLVDEENLEEDDRKRLLDLSYSESIRLGRMVRELLDLARVEAGVTEVKRERVVIRDLMKELRDVHEPLAARKSVRMEWNISDFVPTVIGDHDLLLQAFVNLIGNAVKYTRESGHVEIEAGVEGDELRVVVRDDGIGIASEDLDRIFDRFYRASSARKSSIPGTGLGLPMARFIIETHGGRVDVESEEGSGSTFTVFLPREEAGSEDLDTSSLQSVEPLTRG